MIKIGNLSTDEFIILAAEKKVICFCAGQKFSELCEKYEEYELVSHILYVVDNYEKGTEIAIKGKKIPVVSASEMGKEAGNCILLITSMRYADEMIFQLDEMSLCDGLTFYIPDLFRSDGGQFPLEHRGVQKIPKSIHYCWFGKGKMPERFCKNIETWKKQCPDYEIIRWDEENYDISKNQYIRQAYEAGKWSFVSDYARVDIINENGGIYLDTDVEVLKSYDPLLQFDMFCGFETDRFVNFGIGFGAEKGNRVLEEILELYRDLEFFRGDGTWNLVTSPLYQTEILNRHGLVGNGQTQIKEHIIILSPEYLSPVNPYGYGAPTEKSFSVHQYAATWLDEKQKKEKGRLMRNYEYVMKRMGVKR